MKNKKINLKENNHVNQIIQKYAPHIKNAEKKNDPVALDRLQGKLKTILIDMGYNWKQDAFALELIGDELLENKKSKIVKKSNKNVLKEDNENVDQLNSEINWLKFIDLFPNEISNFMERIFETNDLKPQDVNMVDGYTVKLDKVFAYIFERLNVQLKKLKDDYGDYADNYKSFKNVIREVRNIQERLNKEGYKNVSISNNDKDQRLIERKIKIITKKIEEATGKKVHLKESELDQQGISNCLNWLEQLKNCSYNLSSFSKNTEYGKTHLSKYEDYFKKMYLIASRLLDNLG